jgi:hypothetical protein
MWEAATLVFVALPLRTKSWVLNKQHYNAQYDRLLWNCWNNIIK